MSDVPQNRHSYLDAPHGLASWLLTKDHKRIAMLYLISITIFFAVVGLFATGIRLELLTPRGDLWSPDLYNKLFTLHGVVMIFFFLIPSIPATLGNFLIPIQIGAKDLAFPRVNLLSWYIYVIGALFTLAAVFAGGEHAAHGEKDRDRDEVQHRDPLVVLGQEPRGDAMRRVEIAVACLHVTHKSTLPTAPPAPRPVPSAAT